MLQFCKVYITWLAPRESGMLVQFPSHLLRCECLGNCTSIPDSRLRGWHNLLFFCFINDIKIVFGERDFELGVFALTGVCFYFMA